MNKKLTAKQSLFVQEYLTDFNATDSAIKAGYSEKTAYSIGCENLKKPEIQKAIQEATDKRIERTKITQDSVLKNIEALRAKAEEENQLSVAARCLELQGKHLRMFVDDSRQGAVVQVVVNRS